MSYVRRSSACSRSLTRGGFKLFLDTGKLGELTALRKKLKLPETPLSGADELKELIAIIRKRDEANKEEQEEEAGE